MRYGWRFFKMRFLLFIMLFSFFSSLYAAKLGNIASIVGVRENQLIGYGLVVGLNGSGDGSASLFTLQSLANMLESVNVKVDAAAIKSKNVAAVMITAKLPAFGRQGDKIDVLISSIGDAKSIEGGTLLMTPLKGVDGEIYAIAQGPVSIGGKNDGGALNHPLAGTIYGGGVVEREVIYDLYNKSNATLSLKDSNFANAIATQAIINSYFKTKVATAIDPRTIRLSKPEHLSMIEFLAEVENLEIEYSKKSKIVIDERTGTVVAGIDVTISPIVITHGELTIKIDSTQDDEGVDLGDGLRVRDNSLINTKENPPTVANVARALQKLGATPKDIIAIVGAIKRAGAISAELEIL